MDRLKLEPADGMAWAEWNDAVAGFDTAMFTHQGAWLTFLEERGRGRVLRFRIVEGASVLGYFAALLVKKGPFRILGSPLSGSMSEYMGPAVNRGFEVEPFLAAFDGLCRARRIHSVELGSPIFEPGEMARHGYEESTWMTFRIPLSAEPDAMWAQLSSKCRNRIRKGRKNGLVVEDADPSFVITHYAQLEEIFGCHGWTPPFPIDDLRALVENLTPHDLVFALQVRREDTNDIVATGIFPHDGRRVYSLSVASRVDARRLCPNELLHWSVMERAGPKGLVDYSIGDNYRIPTEGGRFKDKFRGVYEPVHRFTKHYSPLARYARSLYTTLRRWKRRAGR